MGLTNKHVGPKIYVLTRAELLFQVCYEIPYIYDLSFGLVKSQFVFANIDKNQNALAVKYSFQYFNQCT